MKSLPFNSLFNSLLFAFAILFSASALFAWTGPAAAPPGGNVPAPVNVGSVNQVKDGGLSLNGLAVFGNALLSGGAATYLNFGNTPLEAGYGFRDNNGVMEYKNSAGAWTPFGVSGSTGYTGSFTAPGTSYTKSANNSIYAYGTFTVTPTLKFNVVNGLIVSAEVAGGTAVLNGTIRCDPSQQHCLGNSNTNGTATASLFCTSSGFTYVSHSASFYAGAYGKADSTGATMIKGDQSCTSSCSAITQVTCSL